MPPAVSSALLIYLLACVGAAVTATGTGAQETQTPMANASGVFLNDAGDVLTARHAVEKCASLFAIKGTQVAQASVLAVSAEWDLAVLRTTLKPYLHATLASTDAAATGSVGVFAEAYAVLQELPERGALLSNAMTVPGAEGLQLLSGVQPGASGSAVLNSAGLMLGVVVERVAAAPHASGTALSRTASTAGAAGAAGATQVRAVPASQVRQFLTSRGIPFTQSDYSQLSPRQSTAARASTLSVGVLCG